jgi:uncharacterized membrane protein YphA (DoxX/SURF4 family)
MKILTQIARLLVGGLFIFSGMVKAIDPLGTAYKMEDYFHVWGTEFMVEGATFLAVMMIAVEIILGVALLLGYMRNLTVYGLLALIIFFTFLTGYTWVTGEPKECGCFGDAIPLTSGVSFLKDIILTVLIVILVLGRNYIKPLIKKEMLAHAVMGLTVAFSFIYCLSNYLWGLPDINYRPFKTNANITEITSPEPIKFVFLYREKGTVDAVPQFMSWLTTMKISQDQLMDVDFSNLEYVDRVGLEPDVEIFYIDDGIDGMALTGKMLADSTGPVFMVISWDVSRAPEKAFSKNINPLYEEVKAAGHTMFLATSTPEKDKFREKLGIEYPIYNIDDKLAKRIIRGNPSLIILDGGEILARYHWMWIPDFETIQTEVLAK